MDIPYISMSIIGGMNRLLSGMYMPYRVPRGRSENPMNDAMTIPKYGCTKWTIETWVYHGI